MKLVLVRWYDAVTDHSGWKPIDGVRKQRPPLMQSVGWVLADCKSHITLIASKGASDCDGDVTIPKGMIKDITPLTKVQK